MNMIPMKKPAHNLIAEVPGRRSRVEMTIGLDLGDVWRNYCSLHSSATSLTVASRMKTEATFISLHPPRER
jgi:hypothetical protein